MKASKPGVERKIDRTHTNPRAQIEVQEFELDMARSLKNKPLSSGKLPSSNKINYFRVFLWSNQADYEAGAHPDSTDTTALCVTDSYRDNETQVITVRRMLGTIHFVCGSWGVNTVAHECQHAILHRMRYLTPTPDQILPEWDENHDADNEEVIAYEAGAWVESCLTWLTNTDPQSPYPAGTFNI